MRQFPCLRILAGVDDGVSEDWSVVSLTQIENIRASLKKLVYRGEKVYSPTQVQRHYVLQIVSVLFILIIGEGILPCVICVIS